MWPLISIVIPTYKRESSLGRLLINLSGITYKNFEVIVVEQGESHIVYFKKLVKRFSFKYFLLKNISTPKAMNLGVEKAKGDYILFFDDDVTVTPRIIDFHVGNFVNPNVAATVGRVLTDGQKVESGKWNVGRITWLGFFTDGFSSTVRQHVDTVIACNTCWRKDVYQKIGGMDERFSGNALRLESDLSLRAKKAGYDLIFEPRAVVNHHRARIGGARKSEGRIQWYKDFFSNETYFFLKHFSNILLPFFIFTKIDWALKCMFGFGREVSWRSIITPFVGIIEGTKKYYDYRS